jgi:DNA repair exonuclease SbcCD nuclease subunit
MQREHVTAPVDAVILLGDNFYPDGLLADEMVPRILENVARPYCDLVAPSAELAAELGDDCGEPGAPPLFAVVGNHDLRSRSSVPLQKSEVPRFVLNWEVPDEGGPTVRELPGGISLVFLVSESPWGEAQVEALAAALDRAQGPFRVVVGHRPPITGHPGLSQMVARASNLSQRVIHAYLAGHVHGLGAIRGQGDAPALTVIAGSGSRADLQESPEYQVAGSDRLLEVLGFARLDSYPEGPDAHLEITLFEARRSAIFAFLGHRVAARYAVSLTGGVQRVEESSR